LTSKFLVDFEKELGPKSVDWIILGNVLCEIPDVDEALRILDRLLKPGGRVYYSEHVRFQGLPGRI